MTNDQLVDKRTVDRNISKGLVSEAEHKKYLSALPDLASKSTFVDYSIDEASDEDDDGEED